jgi:hypothetical protein
LPASQFCCHFFSISLNLYNPSRSSIFTFYFFLFTLSFGMWAAIIAAPETFFRLAFLDLCREHRKLLFQLPAAAVCTFSFALTAGTFQQFGYPAAVIAFIFVNRHRLPREISFNFSLFTPARPYLTG